MPIAKKKAREDRAMLYVERDLEGTGSKSATLYEFCVLP
jgi:hypothetical protein